MFGRGREAELLIETLPSAVVVIDALGVVHRANPSAQRLLGPALAEASLAALVEPPDASRVEAWVASVFDGPGGRSVFLGPLQVFWTGARRLVDLTAALLEDGTQMPRAVVSVRDVTYAHAEVSSRLAALASTDALTGLLNRGAFQERAQGLMHASSGSLMYVDLDAFKSINDRYGHEIGDEVLRAVADRVAQRLGPEAIVARLGGDEFAALLPGVPLVVARRLAQAVVDAVRVPMDLRGEQETISVSIGVTGFDELGTLDRALAAADTAMYVAKREGRDQVVSFDEGLRTLAERRQSLIDENKALRAAAVRYSVEARTDAGTGLPNLRRLLEDLAVVHDRARRSATPYSLLFLDLDHFGTLNKRYGDHVGDETLVAVARTLMAVMRDGEIVYRKGGEELVVILWDTDLDGGVAAAHRYRTSLVDAALPHGGHPDTPVVTASFGVAEGPGDGDASDVLRIASLCMLSAKAYGRNRVSVDAMPVPDHPNTA